MADDKAVDVLEDATNTSVEEELIAVVDDLAERSRSWWRWRSSAAVPSMPASRTTRWRPPPTRCATSRAACSAYPMLSSFLEAGLAAFDMSCDDIGQLS